MDDNDLSTFAEAKLRGFQLVDIQGQCSRLRDGVHQGVRGHHLHRHEHIHPGVRHLYVLA